METIVNPNMKKEFLVDLSLASRLSRSVAMIKGVWMKLGMQNREGIMGRKKRKRDESRLFSTSTHELVLPSLFDL